MDKNICINKRKPRIVMSSDLLLKKIKKIQVNTYKQPVFDHEASPKSHKMCSPKPISGFSGALNGKNTISQIRILFISSALCSQ